MTRTRTDVHAPASADFDPEAYDLQGVFDLHPDDTIYGAMETARRMEVVQGLIGQGYRFGGIAGRCGHCGTGIRYAALMTRDDVRQMIYVGETCLENRFEALTKADFQALRESARLNRLRAAKAERIAEAVEAHPLLAWLTYPDALVGYFVQDVAARFRSTGELTDRQIEAVEEALVRDTEKEDARVAREAAKAALAASGVQAPEGRVVVEGEVVSTRIDDTPYGVAYKMVVRADEGWAVWSTVPSAILDGALEDLKGARVRFTATLERSDRDALFAFAKRPTKAAVL